MKIALIALFGSCLAATAHAVVTTGLEAGYLVDNNDTYWSVRVGREFKTTTSPSHQAELELG